MTRLMGEMMYMPVVETGCWIWLGTLNSKGYGSHRRVYERLRGPIPEGLTLEHTCRVKCCVNPDHLVPMTLSKNQRQRLNLPQHGSRRGYDDGCREECCRSVHNARMRAQRAKRKSSD